VTDVWRVSRSAFLERGLSGRGVAEYPGRWNHRDVPVVYASSTSSLAILEYLAHIDPEHAPTDLLLLQLKLPATATRIPPVASSMPVGWDALPPGTASRDLGTAWLLAGKALVARVPSVLLPPALRAEFNVLINPKHAAFSSVQIVKRHSFPIDPRFLQ